MTRNRSAASRLEDFLSGIVEGVFGRVFRTNIQPVELERKLERTLEENITSMSNAQVAPNAYTIWLSPQDFAKLSPSFRTLTDQFQRTIVNNARQNRYKLTTNPVIVFKQDDRLGTGESQIEAQLLDGPQLQLLAPSQPAGTDLRDRTVDIGPSPDQTLNINGANQLPAPTSDVPPTLPYAALILRTVQGVPQTFPLNREVIHIGRHTSNDIVVNDRRVSRYHAEIRYERGQFVIYDLGSLNGVPINGSMTRQAVLRNGDILVFGNYSFVFERR